MKAALRSAGRLRELHGVQFYDVCQDDLPQSWFPAGTKEESEVPSALSETPSEAHEKIPPGDTPQETQMLTSDQTSSNKPGKVMESKKVSLPVQSKADVTPKQNTKSQKVDLGPQVLTLSPHNNDHKQASPSPTSRPSTRSKKQELSKGTKSNQKSLRANSSQSSSSLRSSLRVQMKKKEMVRGQLYQAILQGKADANLKVNYFIFHLC